MHPSHFYTILATGDALASANSIIQKRATTACSTPSGNGFCSDTSTACTGGTYYSGYCPGASDIQCCVTTCGSGGVCEPTSASCSGSFTAGLCPGPSDVQCCSSSSSSGGGGGGASGVPGIDVSGTPPSSFWSCAASSYQVVALEGYIQGCASGGEVKSNFVSNYNAAAAAGVSRIDAYLFPCTGTQDNGVACKDPSTQLQEFLDAVDGNGMSIGNYWFDIEPTSTASGDACNAWNLGSEANEGLAKQWVAALQGSGRNWGIYANGNQWTSMFASRDTDIGSQLPLWAVQDDNEPGVDTVTTFMGGWTSAVAKQYSLDTTACGSGVDLDSFTA